MPSIFLPPPDPNADAKAQELRDTLAYFETKRQDAMLKLDRARKARMRADRDIQAMADFWYELSEVELILKEMAGEYEAPEVVEGYYQELSMIRRAA